MKVADRNRHIDWEQGSPKACSTWASICTH